MIQLKEWIPCFVKTVQNVFGERIYFVGLQGSYGRGEANEKSDIDIVMILDELKADDIRTYNDMLDGLSDRELICGFFAGKQELLRWEPSELFQLYFDTTPLVGTLDVLVGLFLAEDIARAVRIGAGNIYHGLVHNMLYEKSEEILKGLLKSASFVIQADYYRRTGKYIRKQQELLFAVDEQDRALLKRYQMVRTGADIPFEETSEMMFSWVKGVLNKS